MSPLKVEAGDSALNVLAEIMEMAPIRHTLGLNHTYESGCRCLRCKADSAIERSALIEASAPRVEAGDRALDTARKIQQLKLSNWHCDNEDCPKCIPVYAALIQSAMNAQERELREALGQHGVLIQAAKAVLETAGVLRAYDVGGDSGDVKPFCEALNDLEDALGVIEGLSELRDGKTKSINEVRAAAERLLAERGEGH